MPYNPLGLDNLAESIVAAMLRTALQPLPPADPFSGAGVYAVHYVGRFSAYARLGRRGREVPIYIGKAIPAGARKGRFEAEADPGPVLYRRLAEHAKSVDQARNLDRNDFLCRYLVTDEIWIPLGENLLIEKFRPLWNAVIDGFGNHDPGGRRAQQQRSPWDVVHPGRPWAEKLGPNPRTARDILKDAQAFLDETLGA